MAAHKAITASSKGKESQLYTLAKNHSVLDSDLITNELKESNTIKAAIMPPSKGCQLFGDRVFKLISPECI